MSTVSKSEVENSTNPVGGTFPGGDSTFGACGTAALAFMMLQDLREIYAKIAAILNTGYATNLEGQAKAGIASAEASQASTMQDAINQIIEGTFGVVTGLGSVGISKLMGKETEAQAKELSTAKDQIEQLNDMQTSIKNRMPNAPGEVIEVTQVNRAANEAARAEEVQGATDAKKLLQDRTAMSDAEKVDAKTLTDDAISKLSKTKLESLEKSCKEELEAVKKTKESIESQIQSRIHDANTYAQALNSVGPGIAKLIGSPPDSK